jgi:general secretion pathway protein D
MVEYERTFVMKKQRAFFILVQIFLIIILACAPLEAQVAPPAPPVSGPTPAVKEEVPPPAETKPAAVPPTAPQPGGPAEAPVPPPVKPAEAEKPTPPAVPAPAPAPMPAPAPTRPASPTLPAVPSRPRGQGVVFKFDNADLYEVIRTMAEILKINYVIDPRVRGTVNINTSGAISQEDVYPLFLSILRMNGATIVKRDSVYEIVPIGEGKKLPGSMPEGGKKIGPEDRFAIEIIKPSYISITELEKIIKPFLSDEKEVISYPQNNILIVADLLSNIRKIRDIIGLFDVDIFTNKTIGIFPVLNSDATEVSKDLERIFTSLEVPSKSGRGIGITFTPVARLNAVLVVSSIPGIMDKVENWIKELDKPPTDESKMWVQVYYVQNTKAKDLAEVLKQIYAKGKETTTTKPREEPKPPTPTPAPATRTTRTTTRTEPTPAPTPAAKEESGAALEGDINIVVDEVNNALIMRCRYRDYRAILETIKKLDLYPKQVLIEVMIAEITLDDSLNYGLEWFRFITSHPPNAQEITVSGRPPNKPFDLGDAAGTVFGGGVRYAIVALGERLAAAIHAAAAENRLNIISSPHLLASNNKEAKIQIGSEEPIITQTYTSGTSTTVGSDILGQSIEYKDVGIIMTVTPRISDAGLITLEIEIEDSQVGTANLGTEGSFVVPRFLKKVAKTTLSVLEGQIIVIGGLIGDTKTANKSGVPYLNKVPVFGGLFGTQNSKSLKTETIIVMTPHIITDANQSRSVTQEFRQKVRGIQEEIQRRETGAAPPPKAPAPSTPPPEALPQYEAPFEGK